MNNFHENKLLNKRVQLFQPIFGGVATGVVIAFNPEMDIYCVQWDDGYKNTWHFQEQLKILIKN